MTAWRRSLEQYRDRRVLLILPLGFASGLPLLLTFSTLFVTTLSITHDMASARKISSRIAMLYQGKIIWDGPTASIDTSGNPYVDQFIHGRAEGPIKMEVRR